MSELTLLEKIEVLGKLLFSSPAIIGIFAFSLVLMIVLFFNNKLNKKIIKIIFIVIYSGVFGYTIFKYGGYFLTSIDSFITLFMANIYFPTIPVYVFIMIISFIIMIFTLSTKNKSKIVKIINIVFFTIIQMLFVIFIFIVESTKIDVSSNQNIYTNEQTLTLLELGMGLFVIWIIVLLIILYLKKADKIFKSKKSEQTDDFEEYINDYNEPDSIKDNKVIKKPKKIKKQKNVVPQEEVLTFDNNTVNYQFNSVNSENKYDPANYTTGTLDGFSMYNNTTQNNNMTQSNNVTQNNNQSNNIKPSTSVFDNFEFIEVDDKERKNDDAEVIDFDF